MSQKSNRVGFKFWLNLRNPDEKIIADEIIHLKAERGFTSAIRDGIRLVTSLQSGSLDVLFEMFGWVKAKYLEAVNESVTTTAQQRVIELEAENAALRERNRILEDEIAEDNDIIEAQDKELSILRKQKDNRQPAQDNSAIQAQLTRLENLLLAQGHTPINSPQDSPQSHHTADSSGSAGMKGLGATGGNSDGLQPMTLPKPGGPQSLNVPNFSSPTFDDDLEEDETLLEVKRDKVAGDIAVQNFLKSAMGLQGMHHD